MPSSQAAIAIHRDATPPRPQLRALLLCDLVDSTGLIERLGDQRATVLIRQHDELVRQLLPHHEGVEVDKSDGFLLLFERPVQAVAFALDYQRELRALGDAEALRLEARVGIHFGEVLVWQLGGREADREMRRLQVEGHTKTLAARLMGLARPNQILMSSLVRGLAQRSEHELSSGLGQLRWCDHGNYHLRGHDEPMAVHEIGLVGTAPLKAPASGRVRLSLSMRAVALAVPVLAVLIGGAVLLASLLQPAPAVAFRERDWVVVGGLSNLTGDPRFDGALETALRVSLEQSPHVNVLPELRVRDALQRMGRSADAPVDRGAGSEIALREGARALLLPSITEVGGRLRISVEVVDPHTQRTVLSQSADGIGAESALASIGLVNDRLREDLGEAVDSISISSEPVALATSPSLDALRAYTLGSLALSQGRLEDARQQFRQALLLDPEFAMASIGLGLYHFARGEQEQALGLWRQARELEGRLTARERLTVEARIALAEREKNYPARWKALLDLYPDHYPAAHNYAVFMWHANRFRDGIEFAQRASAPQSITRPASSYTLAYLLLADNQYEEALATFRRAVSLGWSEGESMMHAATYAAQRRYEDAAVALHSRPPISPAQALERRLVELAMSIDGGRWNDVSDRIQSIREEQETLGASLAMWAGLAAPLATEGRRGPREERLAAAQAVIDAAQARLDRMESEQSEPEARELVATALLYAAYTAALNEDSRTALAAAARAEQILPDAPLDVLANLHAIALARVDASEGRYDAVLTRLERLVDGGELYLTHALLGEAYAGLGRHEDALREMQWLRDRRGQAYAEPIGRYLLQAENVLQSNIATLASAEIALAAGDRAAARQHADELLANWPLKEGPPELVQRMETVLSALSDPP